MIPQTLGAILVFVVFIVPGVAFEMLRDRRLPDIEESSLREASRVAMTSALFSLGAVAVIGILRLAGANWVVDPALWLTDGQAYVVAHMGEVISTVLVFVAAALALVALTDSFFKGSAHGQIKRGNIWRVLTRTRCPEGANAWVHLRLKDEGGTEVWGYFGDHAPRQGQEDGPLVLEAPGLAYRRPDRPDIINLTDWSFIAIRGEDIAWMKVRYHQQGQGPPPVLMNPNYNNVSASRWQALVSKVRRSNAV